MTTPRVTIDDLPEQSSPEDANLIPVQDAGVTKKITVANLLGGVTTTINDHLGDADDAHDASAISATPGTVLTGTDVQAQLNQTDVSLEALATTDRVIDLAEQSPDPAAPAADTARLFVRDDGSGKTQLCVLFPTGAVQVLATEP